MSRTGRPIEAGGPAIAAGQVFGERTMGWCDGHFSGDKEDVAEANRLFESGIELELLHVKVDNTDPLIVQAAAVMKAVLGDVVWTELPSEVIEYIELDEEADPDADSDGGIY